MGGRAPGAPPPRSANDFESFPGEFVDHWADSSERNVMERSGLIKAATGEIFGEVYR